MLTALLAAWRIHITRALLPSSMLRSSQLQRKMPHVRNVLAAQVVGVSQLRKGDDPNPSSGVGPSALKLVDVHLARFQAIFHLVAQSEICRKGMGSSCLCQMSGAKV